LVVAVVAVSMVLGGTGYAASRRAAKAPARAVAVVVPVWRTLTPMNGWSYGGYSTNHIAVYKDANGVVHLHGSLKGGTSGSVAFTLPRADRPKHRLYIPIYTNNATIGGIQVNTNGQCQIWDDATGTATLYPGLDGVSFPVP
jgi:hypothetical protein